MDVRKTKKCVNDEERKKYRGAFHDRKPVYDGKGKTIYICNGQTELKIIGEESSDASVYSGICKREKEEIPVAVKILKSSRSEVELCTFMNKELQDENVVPKIYDYFSSGDYYIIVMDFLNMSLARYIFIENDTTNYDPIAIGIVGKVEKFHKAGFVHGDLHCNNVMIKDCESYIIDFDRMADSHDPNHDVSTLIDSLDGFPLDWAEKEYGYKSSKYREISGRVELMKGLLKQYFEESTFYQISFDEGSDSDEEFDEESDEE
jgi:tRNA A-37 threonylcarbamoyl transferase component Bud32